MRITNNKFCPSPCPRSNAAIADCPSRCGSIEAGRAYYCCSGCALASRLPPAGGSGQFPVTPALVAALGVGFVFFNEVLFWTLALELAREHRAETALLFARLSAGPGVAGLGGGWSSGMWRAAGPPLERCAGGAGHAGGHRRRGPAAALGGGHAGANAALGLWLGAGLGQAKILGNKSLTV